MSRLYCDLNLPSCSSMDEGKDDAAGRRVDTFTLGGLWSAGLGVFAALCNPAPTHLAMLYGATPLARPNSAGGKRWAMIYGMPVVIPHWYRARPDLLGRLAHPRSVRAEAGGGRQRRRDDPAELDYGRLRHAAPAAYAPRCQSASGADRGLTAGAQTGHLRSARQPVGLTCTISS